MFEILKKFLRKHGVLSLVYYKIAKRQYYRFEKFATYRKDENSEDYVVTTMRILIHEFEKGFSLPQPRVGFGKEKVRKLVKLISIYEDNYMGVCDELLVYAKSILKYYADQKDVYNLDITDIPESIIKSEDLFNNVGCEFISYEKLCQKSKGDFSVFSQSRHSIRSFVNTDVNIELISKAVELAQSAPSACNRQAVRVYHISGLGKCEKVLNIQGGYKGASKVNDLLLICSDLTAYTSVYEVNTGYVDGGIFAMNLMYALHYYGIGSCPLLWNDDFDNREIIRKEIDIPLSQMIVLALPIGYYEQEYIKYAASRRKSLEEVLFHV